MNTAESNSVLRAFFSPQVFLAALAIGAFWMTIIEPDKIPPQDSPSTASSKEHIINSPEILKEAQLAKPSQLLLEGKADLAVASATKLAESKPHEVLANIVAGNVLFEVGDKDTAFRQLKRSVALAPRSRFVRLNLAEKLQADKRYDEAIAQYQLIMQSYPHWSKPHQALADIYLAQGQAQQAADELQQAINAEPNNGALKKMRGLALAQANQARKGLEEYAQGDSIELNNQGMPPDIKQLITTWGSLDRVVLELHRQLNRHGDDVETKLSLARVLYYTNQAPEAKALLLEARKQAPNQANVRRSLALVMNKLGEQNVAISEFMASVKLETEKEKENTSQ